MAKDLKELIAEADKHGYAVGSPIELNEAERELVGNAYYLDPSQTLRHFLKFEFFLVLLGKLALRLRSLDGFDDDPSEGKLSGANSGPSSIGAQLTKQWGIDPETDGWKQFINGTHRRLVFIHCWFGQEDEDREMWNRYGDGGKGICLRTTIRRFNEAFDSRIASLGRVTYLDETVPIPTIIPSLCAFRKRPQFRHEKEFRLVRQLSFEECPRHPDGEFLAPPSHVTLPVDLDRLLEAVVVGPNAEESIFERTESAVRAIGLSRIVRRSRIAGLGP